MLFCYLFFFFFNDTATTEIYTLSLHDALPIYPELGERQLDRLFLPRRGEALRVELESPALEHFLGGLGLAQRVDPAEQRRDAREQMRQAHVLGEVVVGAQAQARDRVEVRVARGEEQDRQRGRHRAQIAAQDEPSVGLIAQADIDQ